MKAEKFFSKIEKLGKIQKIETCLGGSCLKRRRRDVGNGSTTSRPKKSKPAWPLANFSSVFKPVFGLFGVAGLYVSKGRPLVWWYGGVKVALRIDSRDASDFAKKIDLYL